MEHSVNMEFTIQARLSVHAELLEMAGKIDSKKAKVILDCGGLIYDGIMADMGGAGLALYVVPQIRLVMLISSLGYEGYQCWNAVTQYQAEIKKAKRPNP
jgi:hypothetical protein